MSSLMDRRFYRDNSSAQLALAKSGAYFWVGLALLGLAMFACAVPASIYAQVSLLEMPLFGP